MTHVIATHYYYKYFFLNPVSKLNVSIMKVYQAYEVVDELLLK